MLAAYRAALQSLRDAEQARARAERKRAVASDSGMAMAHLRLALTSFYDDTPTTAVEEYRRAMSARRELDERDRAMLDALQPLFEHTPASDAVTGDATPEASTDAPGVPDSAPSVCGDGFWDPKSEGCDDGPANADGTGACSTTCQVQDFLASSSISSVDAGPLLPFQYPPHTLGQGRHPIAVGSAGFALSFLEQEGNGDFTLRVEAFSPGGARAASFPIVGTPGPAMANADPVMAPLSNGRYAVLWGDVGTDTVGPGIAMATVDPATGAVGATMHANDPSESPETAPDALWLGSSLVVAWADAAGASSDLKLRTFDASLNPTGAETYLANTAAGEVDVTLAAFNGTWAAAWRASENGFETVHIKSGGVEVVTNSVWGGPSGERPALVQVGPTTLFVAFAVTEVSDDAGDESTTVLQGAVVDMTKSGTVTTSQLPLDAQADGGDGRFPEATPATVTFGGRLWLAAWTDAQPGDPLGEEVWLARGASTAALSVGATVSPLPRVLSHRGGDQRNPALAMGALGTDGVLLAAWEDDGAAVGGNEARPDVVLQVTPLAP